MLHILICDDDRTFADFLSQQITLLPDFDRRCMKITTLDDPRAIDKSVIETSDLIFLDIDMGDINGLSLARKMRSISLIYSSLTKRSSVCRKRLRIILLPRFKLSPPSKIRRLILLT